MPTFSLRRFSPLLIAFCLLPCLFMGRAGAVSTSYALSNSAFVLTGGWVQTTNTGHNCKSFNQYYSQIAFAFTGTEVDLTTSYVATTGLTMKYKLDGGAWTTIAGNAGTWTTAALVSGLTDGPHTLVIKGATFGNNTLYLDSDTGITVQGASPAVSVFPALNGPIYWVADTAAETNTSGSPGLSYLRLEDPSQWLNQGGPYHGYGLYNNSGNVTQFPGFGPAMRFVASFSGTGQIWIYAACYNQTYALRNGDVAISTAKCSADIDTTGTPEARWILLGDGLPQYPSEYTIESVNTSTVSGGIFAICLVNGNSTAFTGAANPPAPRPYLATFGDSFTQASTMNNSGIGYSRQLAALLGDGLFQRGVGGTTVHNYAGTTGLTGGAVTQMTTLSLEGRNADITGLPTAPSVIVDMSGTNDVYYVTEAAGSSGVTIGIDGSGAQFTPSQYKTSWVNILTAQEAAFPSATILVPSIMARSNDASVYVGGQSNTYWRGLLNTAAQAAVAQVGGKAVFLNWNALLTQPGDYLEGIHPNGSGYRKMATALYKALQPSTGGGTKRKTQ